MRRSGICLFLALVSLAPASLAELSIAANALAEGRAMLTIDGKQRMLRVGQVSPEGVKLVSANAEEAMIEVEGKRLRLEPGREPGGGYATPERRKVSIPRNGQGQYNVGASINGHPVTMLVDTGANVVALSGAEASRLGIDYRRTGTQVMVNTAAGVALAWDITLDKVEVGGITVYHVPASVLDGAHPVPALLGMSWLRGVGMREEGGVLHLQQR